MKMTQNKSIPFLTGALAKILTLILVGTPNAHSQIFSGATKTSPGPAPLLKKEKSPLPLPKSTDNEDPDSGLTIQTLVPEKGQFDFRPSLLFGYRDWAGSNPNTIYSDNGYPTFLKLQIFYGLTDYNALELRASYGNYEINGFNTGRIIASGGKTVTKNEGFDAIYLGYRGFYDMTYLFIHWGLGYAYGIQPYKGDRRTNSQSVTIYGGQDMVIPSLTLVMPLESFIAGVGFEYRWAQDGSGTLIDIDGSERRFNIFGGGGQALSLFAELPKLEHLNMELKYDRILGNSTAVPNSAPSSAHSPKEQLRISGSMRFEFGQHFELIPLIYYETYLNKSEINNNGYIGYSKMDEFGTELKIRVVF